MRIRDPLLATTLIALTAAACGDGGEEPPTSERDTSTVTARDVRSSPPPSDTGTAPPTDSADEAETATSASRSRILFTVQVGAFVRDGNARDLRRRLAEAGLPVWDPAAEVEGRGFERIRVGATATVGEARRLVDLLADRVAADPWIAPVAPEDELPAGLVDSTRRLLEEG